MKNKCILATLTAFILVVTSCTTDSEEINSSSQNQNVGVSSQKADSNSNPPTTTYVTEEGTLPPIKPK